MKQVLMILVVVSCTPLAGQGAETLSIGTIEAAGFKPKMTPMYSQGQVPRVTVSLVNAGPTNVAAEMHWRALDHCVQPGTAFEKTGPVTLAAGETNMLAQEVRLTAPGLYWVNVEVSIGSTKVKGKDLGVIYDAEHYLPPLTRPPDFAEFWAAKLRAMRAIPFDEKLAEVPEKGNARFAHYDLEIAGVNGTRLKTFLRVPRKEGTYDAEVVSHWGSDKEDKLMALFAKMDGQPAGVGQWQRGVDRIRVGAPQPDDSKYTRWVDRDDNNFLESYLLNVRMADYLRSRKDVARVWLFGASRSGASMLCAAALSPERVVAVNAHVPTCCGLSWKDKPYRGWGKVPPSDAGYFDPVNFAPGLAVPLVVDGGFYDGLAPAPGILAFHNWSTNAPFRRCSIEQGGHGFFPPINRQRMEQELADFLEGKTR